ncbi:FAD-dependent oxidoreductase [Roseateles toxinivorans]|uniref:Dimethylamine/trimethylamine dehydrogenase n=1 Tax=Roseateles toxinivorans TaxID=270368 RepID=A0A4R6QI23_9BURK|nr:FAD-dependent oxidoreductase [Roseateles toxinivorans]TDP62099.1 dimethylamine/trimethylamine dehydrogenase [Roseateles toxinivorans]
MRPPQHDILFEPVQIGPVRTKNRFYQVPHCNGMGHARPQALAAMRGVKAEGGWGVVCTEEVEVSPHSEIAPWLEGRLWDDADIPPLALMAEACHAHGALAGIELMFNGYATPNRFSREIPMAPSHLPVRLADPIQARAMSKADIADVRRWHRAAALRAKRADFDLVYCYAGHDLALAMHFISRRTNRRNDEYGGSIENRTRFLRELIEDTKDAVGDRCGVVVRFAVDQLLGPQGITAEAEGREVIECLAELPDLWDVNLADWSNDSVTARFAEEGFQERYISFVKGLTTKPVVGVGRYTSPDAMASAVRRGVMDLIGAARPSIADPYLPSKIEQGHSDDIRECIGCNICVTGDQVSVPLRCTQNPTMGEEWRRGWHPERIAPARGSGKVLVVGAGPAGLEAARALGQRGYPVALADASDQLGGRILHEAALPGLASWRRVVEYREQALQRMANVDIYRQSRLSADDVLAWGAGHVLLATGSRWRRDGLGRQHRVPIPGLDAAAAQVFSPDDVLAGRIPPSPVLIYDDDHYVMAGLLAELLHTRGCEVIIATPSTVLGEWTVMTMEQSRVQGQLIRWGVPIHTTHEITRVDMPGHAQGLLRICLSSVYTPTELRVDCASLLLVTMRDPEDALHCALQARQAEWAGAGIHEVRNIGDSFAPGTVAAAVWQGHRAARELEETIEPDAVPFRREFIQINPAAASGA